MVPKPATARVSRLQAAAAILFWVAVWQLAAFFVGRMGLGFLLAGPVETLQVLAGMLPQGAFWGRIGFSAARILGGFALALVFGCLLAALSAALPPVYILLRPLMQFIKATPVASIIILALLWVSSANLSVLISFLMVLPVIYAAVLEGIRRTDPQLLEMARVFCLPFGRTLRAIWLPGVWPYLLQSCETGLGLCWKSGVAAEVIGLAGGSIGEALYQAKIFLQTGELFAWTLVIILVSAVFEKLALAALRLAGRRLGGGEPLCTRN